ncbi:MAG: FecR domain-containing protein [Pyrinomonadaceae bacterium]
MRSAKVEANAPEGARFVSIEGDVRVVRANTRQTVAAARGVPLYPGDAVQTFADGRARIEMVDGSTLGVRPNSVVTVRDNSGIGSDEKTNVRVAVDRGQINIRTQKQSAGATNVVETRQTYNKLAGQTGASFGVQDDETEEIRISSGTVETATKGGEKTVLRGGEYLQVSQSGNMIKRERLLGSPQPIVPKDMDTFFVGAQQTAEVMLRWQHDSHESAATATTTTYHIEVAASPFFVSAGKVYERNKLTGGESTVGEVRPGVYFWRVRAISSSGQTSEWSEPRKFYVVLREASGPVSASEIEVEYVGGRVYLVRGRTQAGNTLRSEGRSSTATSDGSFKIQITVPQEGARDFVLEVEDQQGRARRIQASP